MPLALRDLQAAFAAHLAGAERADLGRRGPGRRDPGGGAAQRPSPSCLREPGIGPGRDLPDGPGRGRRRVLPRPGARLHWPVAAHPAGAGRVRRRLSGLHRGPRRRPRPAVPGRRRPARLGVEPCLPRPGRRPAGRGRPGGTPGRPAALAAARAWRRGLSWSARPIRWTASGPPHNPRRRPIRSTSRPAACAFSSCAGPTMRRS